MELSSQYHISQEVMQQEQLMIEAAKKNPAAFKPLYEKYFEPIYRYVFKRVASIDDARDITQQVFINALANLGKYEFRGVPFTSWLYRIAYNEVIKAVRMQETTRTVSVEAASLGSLLKEAMEEAPTEEMREKSLSICLSALKEEELRLVELRYFENRAFKEVSEITQLTETNAKVKMHRILQKLKSCIQGKSNE